MKRAGESRNREGARGQGGEIREGETFSSYNADDHHRHGGARKWRGVGPRDLRYLPPTPVFPPSSTLDRRLASSNERLACASHLSRHASCASSSPPTKGSSPNEWFATIVEWEFGGTRAKRFRRRPPPASRVRPSPGKSGGPISADTLGGAGGAPFARGPSIGARGSGGGGGIRVRVVDDSLHVSFHPGDLFTISRDSRNWNLGSVNVRRVCCKSTRANPG